MAAADSAPRKKKTLSTRLAWIFLVLAGIWVFMILTKDNLIPVGQQAPDWRLEVADKPDERLDLKALRGKVVVLDFWSLGCPPCIKEARDLETVWRQMEEQDVAVVSVAACSLGTDNGQKSFRIPGRVKSWFCIGNKIVTYGTLGRLVKNSRFSFRGTCRICQYLAGLPGCLGRGNGDIRRYIAACYCCGSNRGRYAFCRNSGLWRNRTRLSPGFCTKHI